MASPQLENGHMKIANELGTALSRVNLSAYESRVLWCVLVKTYGWGKKSDWISYSQFEESTAMDRRHIGRTLKILTERKMISCRQEGQMVEYAIQKDYELWTDAGRKDIVKPLPKEAIVTIAQSGTNHCPIRTQPLPKEATEPLPKEATTVPNKAIYKSNIQKQEDFLPPDFIDKKTWDAFIEMRVKQKSPPTYHAKELMVKLLAGFKSNGQDPNAIIEQSIMNGWKGLFSLKSNGGQNGTKTGNSGRHFAAAETGSYTIPPAFRE